ncbi:MAG: hypothetical protein M0Q21_12455 [Ignavibacteriaceae bacterium]|nr:hypothetical protein [Ignavibacteriaceae bacterium]
MALKDDMNDTIKNEIFFFEHGVQSMNSIFDNTHQLIEFFQDSFFDVKQEREKINIALRENLAKNNSLRRKDFDNMVNDILAIQDESEKEVKNLLKNYLNEQKELSHSLINNLDRFKNACINGNSQEIKKLHDLIRQILAKQDERKNEMTSKLKEFQKEQQNFTSQFKEFLARGNELRIRDFKIMLKEFKLQREERLVLQKERKEDVAIMLSNFKKDREKYTLISKRIKNINTKQKEN